MHYNRAMGRTRRASRLREHRRQRKTLTPPLLDLGGAPIRALNWRQTQPDMLWLAALLIEFEADWRRVDCLEAIDPFVPKWRKHIVDGRLTSFELIPQRRRPAARRALWDREPEALPEALGHALAFFPDCPGAWLYEEWAEERDHDAPAGLAYLRRLLTETTDSRSVFSEHARMLAFGRQLAHRKIFLPASFDVDPFTRYPGGTTQEEGARVRQFCRMTFDTSLMADGDEAREQWARRFWRECGRLARSKHPAARGL